MSTASDARQQDITLSSFDRSLPSFTPIRNESRGSDKAESSASGSWTRSWASHGSEDPEDWSPKANGQPSGDSIDDNVKNDYNGGPSSSKRSKTRHSGGFLLDSAFHHAHLPKTFLSRTNRAPKDFKGKRKSEDSDLIVPRRRLAGRHDQHRSSIGNSPLASEVKRDVDTSDKAEQTSSEKGSQTESRRDLVNQMGNGKREETSKPSMPRPTPPSVGFDTDPAQIVNMALSLSEGRRRQTSGMRVLSGNTADRRLVSAGQLSYPRNPINGGNSEQFLADQRQISQNHSPRQRSTVVAEAIKVPIVEQTVISNRPPQELQKLDDELAHGVYHVSPATFVRVQKAKAHFELLYNYRRLLPHLPPLRRIDASHSTFVPNTESRVYNPLQYVRNRKLRFWEKRPILSEEEGWHDIEQVTAWVDAVIANHHETRHDPNECIRLPDLSYRKGPEIEETDATTTNSPTSSIRRPSENPAAKPRRPKSDWMTHPGDLLADASWLEQGLNKTKIEDREGNKVYPPDTQFQFSGWRNHTPAGMSSMQQPTPPPPLEDHLKHHATPTPPAVPDLPSFTSASKGQKRPGRGRRRDKIRDSIISMPKSHSGSGDRRRKLKQELEMSSSSEGSGDELSVRGRKRIESRRKQEASPSKGATVNYAVEKDTQERNGDSTGLSDGNLPLLAAKRPSATDSSRISKLISRNGSKPSSSRQQSSRRSESIRRSFEQQRQPRSSFEEEPMGRTSAEYDTTAPSSPTIAAFPSIAINLSPPQSRSPSPSKKRFHTRINPFRDHSSDKKRNGISTTDFAEDDADRTSRNASSEAGVMETISEPTSRGTSPMTRGTSPMTKRNSVASEDSLPQHEPHRSSTISRVSTKSSNTYAEHPSKIRGIFKGGRIAELVGNEVSRVGEFIWKRDAPAGHVPRASTSTASLNSLHASDTDEDVPYVNGHALKTPPKAHMGRFPTSSNESIIGERLSPVQSRSTPSSIEKEKPQYYNANLPSFTSPFQRDREQQEERDRSLLTPTSSPPQVEGDHISRLAADHRSVSRSPRMDRLAPPKLNTSGGASQEADRRNSYGFGRPLDLTRSTSASQIFNDALRQPKSRPVTGLASLKTSASVSNVGQDWNINDRSSPHPDSNGPVTRRDIARARALLLSSGAKAREINRRAHAVGQAPQRFFIDCSLLSDPTLHSPGRHRIPKKEEHVVAARNLISSLTLQSALFRDNLHVFHSRTTPVLHTELQALDDLVDNELTPRVRAAADQAGELGMKLSTTSTLAVKGLNDVIDGALRRRRRGPIRYVKRFGYLLIEWTVVGLLWAIWLVVMVINIVLGTLNAVFKAFRWLFWL